MLGFTVHGILIAFRSPPFSGKVVARGHAAKLMFIFAAKRCYCGLLPFFIRPVAIDHDDSYV